MIWIYLLLVMSLIYMGTAVFVRIRYTELDLWPSATLFIIGAAIFIAINDRFLIPIEYERVTRAAVTVLLIIAYATLIQTVRKKQERIEYLKSLIDEYRNQ